MTYQEFAKTIKQKRIEKGLFQHEMALQILCSKYRYSRIENGLLEPTFIELQAICKILEINLYETIQNKKPIEDTKYFD